MVVIPAWIRLVCVFSLKEGTSQTYNLVLWHRNTRLLSCGGCEVPKETFNAVR